MDQLDDFLKKAAPKTVTQNSATVSVRKPITSVDDFITQAKPAPGYVPPAPTPEVKAPTPPPKKSFLNRAISIGEVPDQSELGTDVNKNFRKLLPSSFAENLPFGVGSIVKFAHNDPEAVANVDFEDVLNGIKETAKGTFKGLATAGANFAGVPVKFNIPGLGEVTNRQFNAAQRIAAGEDKTQVLLEEGSGSIFDTLFIVGLASEVMAPRHVTVGKMEAPKDSGIKVNEGPKSFRLYEEPVATQPLSNEVIQKMSTEQGVKLTSKYNPELPSYFKLTGKANGKIVGEVVQVKPSYFNVLKSAFNTTKDPAYTYTLESLKSSGHDYDGAIKSGDIPREKVMNPDGTLVPQQVEHTISDLAIKLNKFKPGVGDAFKNSVDISKPTADNLVGQATAVLNKSLDTSGPFPPVLTKAQIESIPKSETKVLVTKEVTPDIKGEKVQKVKQILPNIEANAQDEHLVHVARTMAKESGDASLVAKVEEAILKGEKNARDIETTKATLDQAIEQATPSPERELAQPIYEPYRPARVPPVTQVYANTPTDKFITGDFNGKPYTSDGFILEFNSNVVGPKKAIQRTGKDAVPSTTIEKLIPPEEDLEKVDIVKVQNDGQLDYVQLESNGVTVDMQRKYYDYFKKKYPNAVFMATGPDKPVIVKSGGENVGMVMPMKLIGKKLTTTWEKPVTVQPKLSDTKVETASPAQKKTKELETKVQKLEKKLAEKSSGNLANLASPQGNKTIRKILERQAEAKVTDIQEPPKDFKISERAKAILEELGVPIAERTLSNRLLGVYKPLTQKVRVQALYDITTVTHEAVHAIDDQVKFSEKLIESTGKGAAIRNRLTDIYEELYPKAKRTHKLDTRIKEGLAVLFENYFYDPASIQAKYPDLVDSFIKPEGEYYHPQFTNLLDKMNDLVDDYSRLSPEERIASRIRTGKEVVENKSGFSFLQRLEFELFNRFEPLKRYGSMAGVRGTWDDPLVQAFNIMNKNTIITNWVKGGETPILLRNGDFRIEKGGVADYLKLVKGNENAFRSYLVARRVVETNNKINAIKNEISKILPGEMEEMGIDLMPLTQEISRLESILKKDDFSLQDASAVVEKYAEQFKEPEKIYDDINRKLIDFSEENDLLDKETADTYRDEKGYTSFKRYIDEELEAVGTIATSSKSRVTSFKERTGSQLDIVDPVYSQINAINEIVSKSMENRLWSKMANLATKNPEIAQRFERVESKPVVDEEGNVSFPQEKDPGTIRVFNKGKREFYKIAPEFGAVVKQLRGKEVDAFVQLLRIPSSLFSRLTTSANPLFAVGNLTVDQFTATAQTKTGFKPIVDPVKSFYAYVTGDVGINAYKAMGGERQTLAAFYDLSPDDIAHKLTGGQTKVEKVSHVIDMGLGILEMPSNASEIMTRYSEYARAVKQGDPMSVAMYKAADVTTPFQLQGNMGGRLGQEYIKSIPYLNAIIQVLYKFGRAAKDDPKRMGTVMAGLLVAGLTTAAWLFKNSTEKQKRLLAEQPVRNASRYLYFPSPNGEDLFKMRIPEQMGVLTGMGYMFMADHYGKNKATFDDYLQVVESALPDQIQVWEPKKWIMSLPPQVLKPSLEVAANVKTFPNVAPIIPPYMIDKAPKEQYNAYTSKSAKVIANFFGTSPTLTDFWINNQFGVVGGFVMGKVPGNPLYIQEKNYVMTGRSYNRFYENRTLVQQQYEEVIKNHPDKYTYKEKYNASQDNKIYTAVSDSFTQMREINKTTDLPENIKVTAYDVLLSLDSTKNITDVAPKIYKLNQEISKFKTESSHQ